MERQKYQESTHEEPNTFVYKHAKFNKSGWADAKKHKPIPHDLLILKTDTGREKSGWWTGFRWKGLFLKKDDEVVKWKLNHRCWNDDI